MSEPEQAGDMSLRAYVATCALQGYLAGRMHDTRPMPKGQIHHQSIAKSCLSYADALIAELNQKETK